MARPSKPKANKNPARPSSRPRKTATSPPPPPVELSEELEDAALPAGAGLEGSPELALELTDDLPQDDVPGTPPREQQNSEQNSEFERLFAQWRATGDDRLRDELILMHRNLVTYLARRFADRGELFEDIIQQGLLGLINALDHFEPAHGVRFVTFATPTIIGEIRRYFRDKTAAVRVPRRMMELHQLILGKIEALTQELDHSPTYQEIARALGLTVEEVIEALEVTHALDPLSLDERVPPESDSGALSIVEQLGAYDPELERKIDYAALNAAFVKLPEKHRAVLQMAYFEGYSQAEIARRMKVSQMHISRVQRRALAQLRELLEDSDV